MAMFVHHNPCDIATRYRFPYFPCLCDKDRIIYIYVVPPKVAKASTIMTVACCCCWHYCLKNIANVNTALYLCHRYLKNIDCLSFVMCPLLAPIDIESLQNRLLEVCYVPATSTSLPRVSFFFSFLFFFCCCSH